MISASPITSGPTTTGAQEQGNPAGASSAATSEFTFDGISVRQQLGGTGFSASTSMLTSTLTGTFFLLQTMSILVLGTHEENLTPPAAVGMYYQRHTTVSSGNAKVLPGPTTDDFAAAMAQPLHQMGGFFPRLGSLSHHHERQGKLSPTAQSSTSSATTAGQNGSQSGNLKRQSSQTSAEFLRIDFVAAAAEWFDHITSETKWCPEMCQSVKKSHFTLDCDHSARKVRL